jgi:hypothetical protein
MHTMAATAKARSLIRMDLRVSGTAASWVDAFPAWPLSVRDDPKMAFLLL